MQRFLMVNANRLQFLLNDILNATVQKFIVNVYFSLDTAKIEMEVKCTKYPLGSTLHIPFTSSYFLFG
jgi:hypothetical protein